MRKIVLTNKRGAVLVDDADYEWLSQYNWYLQKNKTKSYCWAYVDGSHLLMHRLLVPGVEHVHHENGNGLDNRRCNLKGMTPSRHGHEHTSTDGVHWEASRKKWKAVFMLEGRSHYIGRFNSREEAAKARAEYKERVFNMTGVA